MLLTTAGRSKIKSPMNKLINVLFIFQPGVSLKNYLVESLKEYSIIKIHFVEEHSNKKLLKLATDADIIIGWRPTYELLRAAQKLSLFINPGTGVQHLIEKFRRLTKERNVRLINGHGNSYFTAQHAVALLLALMNKVVPHHIWLSEGKWRTGDSDAISIPLKNRKVGLCGYGAINRKIHRFLSGFDVEFSVFRKDWKDKEHTPPTLFKKFDSSELHRFLKEIDILIIALPSTSLTRSLIGKKELEILGKDSLLVNVGRGDVLVEKDFYYALKNKIILGAAIDVWFNYRPETDEKGRRYPFGFPFQDIDNVVLSPHRAASPMNDLNRWDEVIENIKRFAEGKDRYINIVDLEKEY
jgi:phosphoglycerate dehydrogenase-like enzyme